MFASAKIHPAADCAHGKNPTEREWSHAFPIQTADGSRLGSNDAAAASRGCGFDLGTAGVATMTPSFTGFTLDVTFGSYSRTCDATVASGTWNAAFVSANVGTVDGAVTAFLAPLFAGKVVSTSIQLRSPPVRSAES